MRYRFSQWLVCFVLIALAAVQAPHAYATGFSFASISPLSVPEGSSDTVLTLTGTAFSGTTQVLFNSQSISFNIISDSQITCTVPAAMLTTQGIFTVEVDAFRAGGGRGFTVVDPTPVISFAYPLSASVGDADTTISIAGTNITQSSVVTWNGTALTTTFVADGAVTAVIPASDLTSMGIFTIAISNPNNYTSSPIPFLVSNTIPTLTQLSPDSATTGSSDVTLTLTGTNFNSTSVVTFGVTNLNITILTPTQITCTVPSSLLTQPGMALVSVANNGLGGGSTLPLPFMIENGVPSITLLSPNSMTAGNENFTLTVTGTNFVPGCLLLWNGMPVLVNYLSSTTLTALISSTNIAIAGTATIMVLNPAPGGGITNPGATFTINNQVPTATQVNPGTAIVGGSDFTLTVSGIGFAPGSVINWNGVAQPTNFISNAQLTATITASHIAETGFVDITVTNPSPGGGTSEPPLNFAVVNPRPTISAINPASVIAGGPAFTMTITGSNFQSNSKAVADATVNESNVAHPMTLNGYYLPTTYVDSTHLTVAVPALWISIAGIHQIRVLNHSPGGGWSETYQTFTINNPLPVATSLSPASTLVGGHEFNLTVNGGKFVSGSIVKWNGVALDTTYVSASQLTVLVPSYDVASIGTAAITITSPTPGGGTSTPALTFTINNPLPVATSLSPSSAFVGGPQFTLTVIGSGFVTGSVVRWNGANLTTTFVSETQLTAVVPAAKIASAGTAAITITSPTPGGGTSTPALTFTINNPLPVATSLSPSSAFVGSPAFTLTVTGSNFVSGSAVTWNGVDLTTTYVNATKLTASVPAAKIASTGTATIKVSNPNPGGGLSNGLSFAITNPSPTVTALTPSSKVAGSTSFVLTVTGTNFVSGSKITWNGTALTTTVGSTTQLTATIDAAKIATAGTASVTVVNPAPGGGTSAPKIFTINNPVPTTASLSPASALVGGAAFTLTINGTNFVAASTANWNGVALTTTYVSATKLTVAIPAAKIASTGTAAITVSNPTPGGGTSTPALTFTINNPVPTLASLNPTSIAVGSPAFTLAITGTKFVSGSKINWNGVALTTRYISATQLTTLVAASQITSLGSASIAVSNPTPGGGVSNALSFAIVNQAPPAITSLDPASVLAGAANTVLMVHGQHFNTGAVVTWNGTALTATSATQTDTLRTVTIPAALLTIPTTAAIKVVNPAPGLSSAAATFTVRSRTIGDITLSPSSANAGDAAFTLHLTGANFLSNSVVSWNSTVLTPIVVSSTQLTVTIPATFVAKAGIVTIKVTTSESVSNPVVFTIHDLGTFGTGTKLISVPYDYPNKNTVPDILGLINATTGAETDLTTVKLGLWNPTSAAYSYPSISSGMRLGIGYWINITGQKATDGSDQKFSLVTKGTLAPASQAYRIPLATGWNLIGDPFPTSVLVSKLGVVYPGTDTSIHTIVAASQAGVVSPYFYGYDTSVSSDYQLLTIASTTDAFQPLHGYWALALSPCTLVIPHP